ncbi:MAG: hypothetical protein KDH96_02315 [Candidatus Riesia sp.]|nr:hypothetical protein [Candidatus Riesia sp.]
MSVHAGALRDRILIQDFVTLAEVPGGEEGEWVDRETRWGRVVPISIVPIRFKSDFFQFDQEQSRFETKVFFRGYVPMVMGKIRLIWKPNRWANRPYPTILYPIRPEIQRGGSYNNMTTVFCRDDPYMEDEDYFES